MVGIEINVNFLATAQLGWQDESVQGDLHKKRANNPTFCRLPKYERKIALQNVEFSSSKLYVYVGQKTRHFS